jgi:hypothetical protein
MQLDQMFRRATPSACRVRLVSALSWASVFVSTSALPSYASQTRTWTESDYPDFEKGNLKNVSLRSDGW